MHPSCQLNSYTGDRYLNALARTVCSDSIEKMMETANSTSCHGVELSTNPGVFQEWNYDCKGLTVSILIQFWGVTYLMLYGGANLVYQRFPIHLVHSRTYHTNSYCCDPLQSKRQVWVLWGGLSRRVPVGDWTKARKLILSKLHQNIQHGMDK